MSVFSHRSNWQRLRAGDWYQADAEVLETSAAAQQLAAQHNILFQQADYDAASALLR
ncbi:hypothetical protein [Nesterenkonia muleiensis]|uniref:hypothetical protein n=1 Tax=Nesterenkonia muleiensis TaxID=2282648 RepID=UPI00139002BC|nr:hypothetical protein [Nesterenkonia muleiensis]